MKQGEETKRRIHMEYTIPHYFEQFRCVAAECEDTCCAGWAIMIDEVSLEKYRKMEGAIGNRVRNSIDWDKGCFCQCDKRCAFLNEDNLCDLHIEAGEHMLCDTCRDYPRHMEEFEGLREGSLSLSCIEAAKLILGCKEPVRFLHFEDDVEDEEYEEFDFLLFTKLMDAREKIIEILQNREMDLKIRIGMALDVCSHIQDAIDKEELFQIDDILLSFGTKDSIVAFQNRLKEYEIGEHEYCSNMRKILRVFHQLEVLKSDWPEYVKRAEFSLFAEGQRAYEDNRMHFNHTTTSEWDVWIEQLVVYFIFTYFCGAVYDGNVLGKMQSAVVFMILIRELALAKFQENSQQLDLNMFVDIAHRVSREIEHSDVNLLRLEKMCAKTAFLQTDQLLRVILY